MWDQLLANIRNQITRAIYHVELAAAPQAPPPPVTIATQPGVAEDTNGRAGPTIDLTSDTRAQRAVSAAAGVKAPAPQPPHATSPVTAPAPAPSSPQKKPGRNEPCFCGSGKKYKKCHGAE